MRKNFHFAFKINVFTSTLNLEKKIGGPSTFYLKLIKERRAGNKNLRLIQIKMKFNVIFGDYCQFLFFNHENEK